MKILMVTPSYYPIIGGTESFIEDISLKLNEMGKTTDVLTFNIDQTWKPWSINMIRKRKIENINGIRTIKIPAITFLPTRFIFQLNFLPGRFLDQLNNYDIIHFHNDVDLSFPLFSLSVNKPKIFHCHLLNLTYKSYNRNPLKKYLFKQVAELYAVPSRNLLKLLTDLGISEKKSIVIPNGIDVERFNPSKKNRIENLMLFVGRIHPTKGLHVLLKALPYLKTRVQLVIIGRPTSRSEYYKKILESIKRTNEKTIHRVFYIGIQKRENIIKWYQKASILLCPSLSESFGIVNIEAMSCETPVVATCIGGIPKVIEDYKNGVLVPPNDAVKLAEAIQYLLDNEETRKKFGENGRKRVVNNFSSEAVAKKLCIIYEKMM